MMIHKTAVIDKNAVIGENVEIGPYTVIGEGVKIGNGTIIGSNAFIEHAEIGEHCKFFNSVSVGTAPQDLSYNNEPSKVYVGDGTIFREFVTINRGTKKTGKTVIGKKCYFMTQSHAGHDSITGDNVILANGACLGGHVEVGNDAFISALSGIHQFCRVGKGTMTAAGTIVTMDTIPYSMSYGYRAVLNGLNLVGMKRRGMKKEDIEEVKAVYKTLFMSKLLLNDALEQLSSNNSVYVKEIVDFIKTSKRGIARPA